MGYIQRKVLFYKLNLYDISTGNKIRIGTNSYHTIFKVLAEAKSTWQTYKEDKYDVISKSLTPGREDQITIDIIEYDDAHAFCRIGRQKDINSYHKRNEKNLSTSKIALDEGEYLEVFSYFLIDFTNGIIAHMYSRSAPNITKFEYLFDHQKISRENKSNMELKADIVAIPNDDAISMLDRISYFSSLDMRFTIPAKELFERQGIKLREKEYLKLADLDSKKVSIRIIGGDKKVCKDKYKDIKDSVRQLYQYKGDELEKLEVKAGIDEGQVEKINLLDEQFNRQVSIKQQVRSTYIPVSNIYDELNYIYRDMQEDLENRIDLGMGGKN